MATLSIEPNQEPLELNYADYHQVFSRTNDDSPFEGADLRQLYIGETTDSGGLVLSLAQLIKAGRLGLAPRG